MFMSHLCFLFSEELFSFATFSICLSFCIDLGSYLNIQDMNPLLDVCIYCKHLFLGCGLSLKVFFFTVLCFTNVCNFNVIQSSIFFFLICFLFFVEILPCYTVIKLLFHISFKALIVCLSHLGL